MRDLLARLQNWTIFLSLDLRSGYHHICLTPEAKLQTAFATTSGKCHGNMVPFGICSFPGVFNSLILPYFQVAMAQNPIFPYVWMKSSRRVSVSP